jgi:hypothetical protein
MNSSLGLSFYHPISYFVSTHDVSLKLISSALIFIGSPLNNKGTKTFLILLHLLPFKFQTNSSD